MHFSYSHIGNYWVQITKDTIPSLILKRDTITMLLEVVQELTADSLALVDLYNATDGRNWDNTWNLDDNVIEWHGVTINDGRVTELDLSNNSLIGTIPGKNQRSH